MQKVKLGVSACLMGRQVRFDGGHKRNAFLVEDLDPFVEWVTVCPEVGSGLPTPRASLRLVDDGERVRLRTGDEGRDVTDRVRDYSVGLADDLTSADLDGFILKRGSPSCGLHRVRIYNDNGMPVATGRGLFAGVLTERYPTLPTEEEGRLVDPGLREAFLERVFARWRLRSLASSRPDLSGIMTFHARHKLQLMTHSSSKTRELGRSLAEATSADAALVEYEPAFIDILNIPVSRGRHVNVMHHVLGYLRDRLRAGARRDLVESIQVYARNEVPLSVPVSLLAHRARDEGLDYVTAQTYLDPVSLGLRP